MVLNPRKAQLGETPHPIALWVVPVSELGGVARHVLDVVSVGLPGWRLVVLCPEGPLASRLQSTGTAVIRESFGPSAGFRASVRTLRRNIIALRPAIVHSHLAYADVVAAVAAIGTGTRLATTEHGIAADDTIYHSSRVKAGIMALTHRARLQLTDVAIAVSEATKQAMNEKWHPRQDIKVIRNGVDADSVRSRIESKRTPAAAGPRLLSLSRLAPEKGIDELLHAFRGIRRTNPEATLTIAGEGPDRSSLEAAAHALGLADSVTFPGFLDQDTAMGSSDVVVQLSTWENCSYTLLDAVAAGLGVVATPVGGNTEILPEQCLTETGDAQRIAAAVRRQSKTNDRPKLPRHWPTRAKMASEIVAAYAAGSGT